MNNDKTKVIFRKFYRKCDAFDNSDNIIAVFPEIAGRISVCTCQSYMHVGQHGAASVYISGWTKPATPAEYKNLAKELKNLGYNLHIIKRFRYSHIAIRQKQLMEK